MTVINFHYLTKYDQIIKKAAHLFEFILIISEQQHLEMNCQKVYTDPAY